MSIPVRVVTNNLGAVPVFEDTANGGAMSVVLEQDNLGAMPVRVLTTRTAGAVPIRYAGSGYTPDTPPVAETYIRITSASDTRTTSTGDTRTTS